MMVLSLSVSTKGQQPIQQQRQKACQDLPLQISILMDLDHDDEYPIINLESCSELDHENHYYRRHYYQHQHNQEESHGTSIRGDNILSDDTTVYVDFCSFVPIQIALLPPQPSSGGTDGTVDAYHKSGYSLGPNEACCICGGGTYANQQQHRLLQTGPFFLPLISLFIGIILTLILYTICYIRRNRQNNGDQQDGGGETGNRNAQDQFNDNQTDQQFFPEVRTSPSEEQIQSDRRELIMNNIIHKAVVTRNEKEDESFMLPHEEIMMKRELAESSFHIPENEMLHDLSIRRDSSIHTESTLSGALYDLSGEHYLRGLKSDIYLMAGATSIPSHDSAASLYSPSTCPICIENYKKGDTIAWSYNEKCRHAFHLECISDWLMSHDECPMCRLDYLNIDESEEA